MTSSVRVMISVGAAMGLVLLALAVSGISALAGPLEAAAPQRPHSPAAAAPVSAEGIPSPRDCRPPAERTRL